ncbi:MAG: hypothetical protein GXO42_01380 [bacterium]|nr:hypothetical protein [bacterium]
MRSKNSSKGILTCPVCGKKTEKLIEGVCEHCYYSKLAEKLIPAKIKVRLCPSCGKFDAPPEKKLHDLLRHRLGKLNVKYQVLKRDESTYEVYIVTGNKGIAREVKVEIEKRTCRACSCKAGGYYEAIVQFRGANWQYAARIFRLLVENSPRSFAFISGEQETRHGVDYRLGSRAVAEQLLKKMEKDYRLGYVASRSVKVVGIDRQTSKPKVRFTYVFRTYDLLPGQIVLYRSTPYLILGYEKDQVQARNLLSNKVEQLSADKLVGCELLQPEIGEVVYAEEGRVVFLDSRNELQEAETGIKNLRAGDKIEYIIFQDKKLVVGHVRSKEKASSRRRRGN